MLRAQISLAGALLALAINSAGAPACAPKPSSITENEQEATQREAVQEAKQREATQNARGQKNKNATAKPTPSRSGEGTVNSDIKVLAEGGHSRVGDAFIAVARDAETYAQLRGLIEKLPEMQASFFKTNAVVAAFLGGRRTGGYVVSFTSDAQGLRISESSPSADMMVTQVLTSPFKVISVPVSDDQSLNVVTDQTWQTGMRPYRIATGEWTMSGGIAGRTEKFQFEGDARTMRHGKLATFLFALKSREGNKSRQLNGIATGVAQPDGSISIAHLDADSFVELPSAAVRATGRFTNNESNLSLQFTPLPTIVADGFSGEGKLEAVATAPPPKRKPSLLDEQ
ncbi:MAG: protease complex subunit PrcB family protein [Pyrinomonadaceae bacterium]|nr:protease complex subunit PrcB family protein [Pyrinomonadaceae bacterium]